MAERLVVVGGDAAGMSAASQARRRRGPEDLEIVAFERGNDVSYSACGIPYWIGGVIDQRDRLVVRTPGRFRERQHIDVRVRHEVTAIDLDAGVVHARDRGAGRRSTEGFDQLLVATGATPVRPDVPGIEGPGVVGLQTLDDGQAVVDHLTDDGAQRAVVVGAGYIGLEVAEALLRRGLEVTLVERSSRPMRTLDADVGDDLLTAMHDLGMDVRLDTAVTEVERDGDDRVRAVATDAGTLPADLVVLGTGSRPASDLAVAAGVPVGESGGVAVDARQRTRVDGVWAAGDCAEVRHRVTGAPTTQALGPVANKTGRVAGINLGGGEATFPGVLGTAITRVCGIEVGRTGLGEDDAREAGYDPVCVRVASTTRSGYWPGTGRMTIKVVAERGSGRLLGAQIVGEDGAAKRIDVVATALWNDMGVDDLFQVDLSYAPPFAPVWDPVLIGARKAWGAVQAEAGDGD